jgi:hypothetical protein
VFITSSVEKGKKMFDVDGTPGLALNEDDPPSPIRVEEKLVNRKRKTVDYPDVEFVGVDNVDWLGEDLVLTIRKKVFPLHIRMAEIPSAMARFASGQVGFITLPASAEPERRASVTALHNVVLGPKFKLTTTETTIGSKEFNLNFPDSDSKLEDQQAYPLRREGESQRIDFWKFGKDIAWGTSPPVVTADKCFSLVRRDFKFEKGQRVGIAVSTPSDDVFYPSLQKQFPGIKPELLQDIYGQPEHRTKIYTGNVTYCGESHIEYDINSFEGCSGAIVFLLDKEQPPTVKPEDMGCAVALHCGAHPHFDRNIGFMLSAKESS